MEIERQNELTQIVIDYLSQPYDSDEPTEGIKTAKEMAFCVNYLHLRGQEELTCDFCESVMDSSS